MGVVLHVSEGLELHEKIFLHPQKITTQVLNTFKLEKIQLSHQERVALVKQLKEELGSLSITQQMLMRKAESFIQGMAWALFFGLCGQFLLFARFTWWDFSWDVMEPVTYFTTVVEGAIAGYIYYLLTRKEYTNMGLRQILVLWQFNRLCRKYSFNSDHYETLKQRIQDLETDIHYTLNQTTFHEPPQ